MLRVVFGLGATVIALYVVFHLVMAQHAQVAGPGSQSGASAPPPSRAIIQDYERAGAKNRSALDRTLQTAGDR
jgi:hypothetical protein